MLTTRFEADHLYARDANTSYNKIDEFVSKTSIIRDHIGDIVYETHNNDQLDIASLQTGEYTLTLEYDLHVPVQYKNFITELETQNKIKLTDRERGILSLQPTITFEENMTPKLRATRSQIYYPRNISITSTTGDLFNPI